MKNIKSGYVVISPKGRYFVCRQTETCWVVHPEIEYAYIFPNEAKAKVITDLLKLRGYGEFKIQYAEVENSINDIDETLFNK